jgi:hypothetical protein
VVRTRLDVAPAREHAAKTKTAGISLPITILLHFRKETRGERDGQAENGRSPHWAKRNNCLFLSSRMLSCRGMGPVFFFEKILFFLFPGSSETAFPGFLRDHQFYSIAVSG